MGKIGARPRVAAALAVQLLVTVVATSRGGASPEPASEASRAPRPDVASAMAAAQLAEDHDVPLAEARRRVQRQEAAFQLAEEYQDRLGPEWAGAYIDHTDAGKLVVQTGSVAATQQATAAEPLAGADAAVDVEIRTVGHTIAELDRAGRDAMTQVKRAGSDAAMMIDVEANHAELLVDAPPAAEAAAARVVDDLNEAQASGESDLVVVSDQSAPEETSCQLPYTLCDAPLRGGVGMTRGPGSLCTVGFNVYSATDLKAYTTATCLRTVVCGRPTVRAIARTGNFWVHNSAISAFSASVSFLTTSLTIDRT